MSESLIRKILTIIFWRRALGCRTSTWDPAWSQYSMKQSDGNSYIGDLVLDSFNMEYSDGDSILDQKYVICYIHPEIHC